MMTICTSCRREIAVGQRVIENHILVEAPEEPGYEGRLGDISYQHSNCLDADGPRYNDDGTEEATITLDQLTPEDIYKAEQGEI